MDYVRPKKLPSVKTLERVFDDRAQEARDILEGKKDPEDYESVKEWVKQCFNCPARLEMMLKALNEISESYGVEAVWSDKFSAICPSFVYLNTGDTYSQTLVYSYESNSFMVSTLGDVVEARPHYYK